MQVFVMLWLSGESGAIKPSQSIRHKSKRFPNILFSLLMFLTINHLPEKNSRQCDKDG